VAKADAKTLQQVQMATETTDKVVFPAWTRGQEREADLLGTDLLVESGQSGPAMLSMLEKLQAWEKANAQSEQAFWDQLGQTAQRNVNDAANVAYQKLVTSVSAAHPKTEERIADTAQYFERYYGTRALVEPKTEPWKAVKSRPEVAIVLRVYRQAFAAKKLLDEGKAKEANALARTAVAGRVAPDAYPNWVLAHTFFALGRPREGLEALRRAVSASDPVPAVYEDLIVFNEAGGGLPAALDWTDRASKTFGGAPRWTPHKIRLLRKSGRVAEANTLAIDCSLNAPNFKRACQEANQTPAGRAPGR
jgi:predicted Zn-dependent protease